MSCIKEFTCTRTFRGGDLYWNTANYQYILRGWKWPNHYFNLCNYFIKLYYRSNIVKKKFLKEWKCFDYNILLSTSISTGVPFNLKLNHILYIIDLDLIKLTISVMRLAEEWRKSICFRRLHSYVYESLDRNELLISQQSTCKLGRNLSNKEICTQSFWDTLFNCRRWIYSRALLWL